MYRLRWVSRRPIRRVIQILAFRYRAFIGINLQMPLRNIHHLYKAIMQSSRDNFFLWYYHASGCVISCRRKKEKKIVSFSYSDRTTPNMRKNQANKQKVGQMLRSVDPLVPSSYSFPIQKIKPLFSTLPPSNIIFGGWWTPYTLRSACNLCWDSADLPCIAIRAFVSEVPRVALKNRELKTR